MVKPLCTGDTICLRAPDYMSFLQLEVTQIVPSPYQHRRVFDDAALRELARSIEQDGLLQPITVRPVKDHFELIAGERRWRAFQLTPLKTIPARVLEVNDLQARRLCATENLQRADLANLEEVMALAELVDASLLLDCGDEYAQIGILQEPKWRVKALLSKLDSDRRNGTDFFTHKFVGKVETIFTGLPKPKEWRSFLEHDLPLLFTPDEVQQFALEHRLSKSQTKAVETLRKAAPEVFKEIVKATPERVIERILELASDPIHPAAESKTRDIEEVRDLSADVICQAAKNSQVLQRQESALLVETTVTSRPVAPPVNPVKPGDWWTLGRHRLYCGDTSQPEFYADLPQVDFAFADPPYGVKADDWDEQFYWEHDWLIDKAPIVAVTPGQPAIVQFCRKTTMPYRNSMASWITNGVTLSEFGYQNWIYLAFFAREGIKLFRQCQDVIRCTINIADTPDTAHRGRKPAEMIARLFELYCPEQGTVLDPFLGSGTSLLIADKTHRTCFGGEIDPAYCWEIIRRWEAQTGGKARLHLGRT